MKTTNKPVILEQTFSFTISNAWKAITELRQMKQWFFESIESFKPEIDFETRFFIKNDKRVFPQLWKITNVEAPRKIVYN